jgi:hypothetical protein
MKYAVHIASDSNVRLRLTGPANALELLSQQFVGFNVGIIDGLDSWITSFRGI